MHELGYFQLVTKSSIGSYDVKFILEFYKIFGLGLFYP